MATIGPSRKQGIEVGELKEGAGNESDTKVRRKTPVSLVENRGSEPKTPVVAKK